MISRRDFFHLPVVLLAMMMLLLLTAATTTTATNPAVATSSKASLTSSATMTMMVPPKKSLKDALDEHLTKSTVPNRQNLAFKEYYMQNNRQQPRQDADERRAKRMDKQNIKHDEDLKREIIAKYGITPLDRVEKPSDLDRRGVSSKRNAPVFKKDAAKTTVNAATVDSQPFVAGSRTAATTSSSYIKRSRSCRLIASCIFGYYSKAIRRCRTQPRYIQACDCRSSYRADTFKHFVFGNAHIVRGSRPG